MCLCVSSSLSLFACSFVRFGISFPLLTIQPFPFGIRRQVNKIRDKCQKQEETIRDMAGEVDSKRGELQKLKDEESSLEREYDANKHELDKVSQTLQDTKLQISQVESAQEHQLRQPIQFK